MHDLCTPKILLLSSSCYNYGSKSLLIGVNPLASFQFSTLRISSELTTRKLKVFYLSFFFSVFIGKLNFLNHISNAISLPEAKSINLHNLRKDFTIHIKSTKYFRTFRALKTVGLQYEQFRLIGVCQLMIILDCDICILLLACATRTIATWRSRHRSSERSALECCGFTVCM